MRSMPSSRTGLPQVQVHLPTLLLPHHQKQKLLDKESLDLVLHQRREAIVIQASSQVLLGSTYHQREVAMRLTPIVVVAVTAAITGGVGMR